MLNQFFGTPWATVATIGNAALLAAIGYHAAKRTEITHWGRSLAGFAIGGLAVCFAAVFRDDYVDSIIASSDPSHEPGLFPADGAVSSWAMGGGAVILLSCLAGIFLRRPKQQQWLFFIASAAAIAKMLIVEISRATQ